MRPALLLLLAVLLAAPEASARVRAVAHRSHPWQAPACTQSTGLPSFGFMHGTTIVNAKEHSDPWSPVYTTGLAVGAAPNTVYATRTDGTLRESTDGGCTWRVLANVPEVLAGKRSQVVTRHPQRIYAYTKDHLVRVTYGTVETFKLPDTMQRVEVDPADPLHLRAIGFAGYVRESRDGGRTWQGRGLAGASQVLASEFDPTNFDRIILHTGSFGTLAISSDGGKTWTYPTGAFWRVDALEISPVDPDVVWLSGALGLQNPDLYRSTDGGKTFVQVVDYTSFLSHSMSDFLAAHPTDPNVVAVPLNIGLAIVERNGARQIWTGSGTAEVAWSPAGTLYFVDLQIRY